MGWHHAHWTALSRRREYVRIRDRNRRAEPCRSDVDRDTRRNYAAFCHPGIKYIESLLALAASNNLADTRCEDVHCCDRSAVVVHSHVEGFNIFWIVQYDHGPLDVLLSQVALML